MLFLSAFLSLALALSFQPKHQVEGSSMFNSLTSRSCPSSEFINPCTCKMTAYGMHIVCLRVPTPTDLSRIFTVLRDYELGYLLLQETELTTTGDPVNFFRGLRVQILRLVDCTLPASVRRALRSQSRNPAIGGAAYLLDGLGSTLTRIDIIHCKLGTDGLANIGLAKLESLAEVNVNRETLTVVKKNWFSARGGKRSRANIRILRLEDNGIASVEENAFASLGSLVVLSLAKNSINALNRNILPASVPELQTLDLSENALIDLPTNFFDSMPAITKVLLYHNNIRTLSQITWNPVWDQLETLWINENPIVCDVNIAWMMEYRTPTNLEGICVEPARVEGLPLSGLNRDLLVGEDRGQSQLGGTALENNSPLIDLGLMV